MLEFSSKATYSTCGCSSTSHHEETVLCFSSSSSPAMKATDSGRPNTPIRHPDHHRQGARLQGQHQGRRWVPDPLSTSLPHLLPRPLRHLQLAPHRLHLLHRLHHEQHLPGAGRELGRRSSDLDTFRTKIS